MRRSRLFRCALGVVLSMASGAIAVRPVAADGVSDQEQVVKQTVAEIDRLDQKVDQLNESYVGYLNQQADLEAQITVAQQKIAGQQAELAQLQGQLANFAVEKFTGGGAGALGPLFSNPDQVSDGLQRDQLARVAVNAGAATTDQYGDLLARLAKEQQALEKKQAKAAQLAQQASDSKAQAESAAADYTTQLDAAKQKLGDLIDQEQARQAAAAYAQQVADSQAQAAKANTSGGRSKSNAKSSSVSSGSTSSGDGSGSDSSSSNGSGSSSSGSVGAASTSSGAGSSSGSSGSGSSGSDGSGGSGAAVPPVSSRASVAINAARSQLGVPYKFAMSSPGVAFDCSGLTAYAWGVAGVSLPHQSAQQYASVPHVPKDQAQPGDLIFYYSPISHVGIYLGGGAMIHAPNTGTVVSISAVRWDKVVGVGRPG